MGGTICVVDLLCDLLGCIWGMMVTRWETRVFRSICPVALAFMPVPTTELGVLNSRGKIPCSWVAPYLWQLIALLLVESIL